MVLTNTITHAPERISPSIAFDQDSFPGCKQQFREMFVIPELDVNDIAHDVELDPIPMGSNTHLSTVLLRLTSSFETSDEQSFTDLLRLMSNVCVFRCRIHNTIAHFNDSWPEVAQEAKLATERGYR